jgi:peptidoglycan/xylan/chitin deacetylase (PgdA/CDA1 family)
VAGALIISLDFELHWGVYDRMTVDDYRRNLVGAREVVPRMLEAFVERDVQVTWATVGALLCEDRDELLELAGTIAPSYADGGLSHAAVLAGLGQDERADPFHFAPSLVGQIAAAPGQELATHTFLHYYCLAPGQTEAQFRQDLRAARTIAERRGYDPPRAIVFPRNQVNDAYIDVCAEQGLTTFRGTPRHGFYTARDTARETPVRRAGRLLDAYLPIVSMDERPRRAAHDLVDVPATRYLRQPLTRLRTVEGLRIRRVRQEIRRAAENGYVHLWWHPHDFGYDPDLAMQDLSSILDEFERARAGSGMTSLTMSAAAAEIAGS